MPTYHRWKLEGATFFFTVVSHNRRRWFERPQSRRWLGASFREARRRLPFEVDAIVLLPDHLHALIRPADGVDYSMIWRLIKTQFTHRLLEHVPPGDTAHTARRSGERGVWQRRFFEHTIRNEEDWQRHADYIHLNPVKHGYVDDPREWAFSSIHRFIRNGWMDPNWPGASPVDLPDLGKYDS